MQSAAGHQPVAVGDPSSQPESNRFECERCQRSFTYQYFGSEPTFCKEIKLKEDAFVSRDPFSYDRHAFLLMGGMCCICSTPVCMAPACSLFYTRRFCLQCVRQHQARFPTEIQTELSRLDGKKT
eukprot:scpid69788/ scgid25638/ UPF0595 protein C22orf40 homolog